MRYNDKLWGSSSNTKLDTKLDTKLEIPVGKFSQKVVFIMIIGDLHQVIRGTEPHDQICIFTDCNSIDAFVFHYKSLSLTSS